MSVCLSGIVQALSVSVVQPFLFFLNKCLVSHKQRLNFLWFTFLLSTCYYFKEATCPQKRKVKRLPSVKKLLWNKEHWNSVNTYKRTKGWSILHENIWNMHIRADILSTLNAHIIIQSREGKGFLFRLSA